MIPVGCTFVASLLLETLSWLVGCCSVVFRGSQMFLVVSLGGFTMIPVGCMLALQVSRLVRKQVG